MKFPAHQDVDAVLRDGSTVHVRPVRPEDRQAVEQFLERLSPESRVFRFFHGHQGHVLGGRAVS